jgi:hypothetical protein
LTVAIVTYRLWQVTRRSVDVAREAADALPLVERAYVYPLIISPGIEIARYLDYVSSWSSDPTDDDAPAPKLISLSFKIKNYGKTPAILHSAYAGFGMYPIGAEFGLSIPESVLGAGETTGDFTAEMQVGITRKQALLIAGHAGALCLTGQVAFSDIWGKRHKTRFIFVWDKDIRQMTMREVGTIQDTEQSYFDHTIRRGGL